MEATLFLPGACGRPAHGTSLIRLNHSIDRNIFNSLCLIGFIILRFKNRAAQVANALYPTAQRFLIFP